MRIKYLYRILSLVAVSILMAIFPQTICADKVTIGDFTIVIDAGHGGHDVGAVDNGVREKDINLGVARKLAALLKQKMPSAKVVMTRDDDTFISLQERANIANRNKGNIFISIHTNSVDKSNPNRNKVAGTSVYALGLNKDANNLQVARRENSVIELESDFESKYSGFDPSKDESYIIFEMAQKKNLEQSLKFANEAQKHLVKDAGRVDRGVKQAGFWVLWATSMPAVLVELDFICNPTTSAFISSDKGQKQLAEALFTAIESYRSSLNPVALPDSGNAPQSVKQTVNKVQEQKSKQKSDSKVKDKKKDSKKNKKEKKGKKSKKGKKDSAEVDTPVVTKPPVVEKSAVDVPVLLSSSSSSKKTHRSADKVDDGTGNRVYSYASARRRQNSVGSRKRRSAVAKRTSDARDISAENIEVRSENDYLAVIENQEEVIEPSVEVVKEEDSTQDSNKNKKSKKNKNQSKGKTKRSKDGRTHITVAADGTVTSTQEGRGRVKGSVVKHHQSLTSYRSNTKKPTKVYKIQILASDEQLNESNPRFHGLKPITAFRENNLYKYTYGESADREEMEILLKDVKKEIPDAFIITAVK